MSLLLNLLKSIDDQELSLLKTELILKGKEGELFNYTLKNKEDKEFYKTGIMELMDISSTHFDKINNVLLRKCYRLLAGEGIDLLHYLNQKLLIKHLLHEIKLQNKIPLQNEEKQEYYKVFFDLIVGVPAKHFNENQAKSFGNKLLHVFNNDVNVKTYIKCRLIYAKLNIIRHGKPSNKAIKNIQEQLHNLFEMSERRKLNAEVLHWLYKSLAFFYIRIEKDLNKHYSYLIKIKELFEGDNQLPIKEKAVNECNIASHYYDTNNLTKAQDCYKDAFNKYYYLLENELRHIVRYVELCILLSDFKLADKLYKNWLAKYLENEHEAHAVLVALTNCKYLIHCNKNKQILPVIQRGRLLNSRMIYFKYDIELRMLENIVFALRKDYDFALELAFKNLKFIASQGLSIRHFVQAHFFRLLISVIYLVNEKVPLNNQALKFHKEYQQGELLIYGVLIDKIKKGADN